MRENLENLVILFAVVAAIATVGWFGYRSVAGWLDGGVSEVAPEAAPPVDETPSAEEADADEAMPAIDEVGPGEETAAEIPTPFATPAGEEDAEAPEAPAEVVPPDEAPPTPEIAAANVHERVAPSTVLVESNESGRMLGAGWVVEPGVVVTSAAVAERASGASIRAIDAASGTPIARTRRVDGDRGIALLDAPELAAAPLEVAPTAPELGQRIHALTDGSAGPGFAEGVVTSLRVVAGARAFAISVSVPAALEGGPVVDEDGRVIGVTVRRVGDEGIEEVVVSSAAVRDLLEGRVEPAATPTRAPSPTAPREEPTIEPRAPAEEPPLVHTARSRPPIGRAVPDAIERRFAPRDYVVESATKLHERPDASSHVVSRLRPGTVVTAVGETEGWLRIRSSTGGRDGYLPRSAARPLRR